MHEFIIDANLPYLFKLWNTEKCIHVFDLNDSMTDKEIWNYAKKNNLSIITKDTDFSTKVLFTDPPPRVIHLRIGDMRMKHLHDFLTKNWTEIKSISRSHKLTNVYIDRIEGIE